MIEDKISIRGLRVSDEKLILHWKENKFLREQIGTLFPINELEHKKWFENKMFDSNTKSFMIEYDDKPIGMIGFNKLDLINNTAEIFMFIGNQENRGKGLGKISLSLFIDFCKKTLNLKIIYLFVFEYNKNAINMYKKLNFKVTGKIPCSKYHDGEYFDTIIMTKFLDIEE